MANPKRIENENLIVVEGWDDEQVINKLKQFLQIQDLQIFPLQGKYGFEDKLKSLLLQSDFKIVKNLGFILDSDSNLTGTFNYTCSILKKHNLAPPNALGELSSGNPQIGIFLLPNNKDNGELEDLFISSLQDDDFYNCAEEYMKNVIDLYGHTLPKLSKRKMITFLTSLQHGDGDKEVINSLGKSIPTDRWDFSTDSFKELRDFLQLFN